MNIDKELFIFGEPVETEVGLIRFLTYKEYLMNMGALNLISMNVLHIYYEYKKMIDENNKEALDLLEELRGDSLFNIVRANKIFYGAYIKIFSLVLDENDEETIEKSMETLFDHEELFMEIRELIMTMNFLSEDEVSPNPEIQMGIEMGRKAKSSDKDRQTPTDIITSIVAGTPNSFKDVNEMTVLQVYSTFYRLGAFKSYDTSTLFATVSTEAKIESWAKSIDLFNREDSSSIKRSEFDKNTQSLF